MTPAGPTHSFSLNPETQKHWSICIKCQKWKRSCIVGAGVVIGIRWALNQRKLCFRIRNNETDVQRETKIRCHTVLGRQRRWHLIPIFQFLILLPSNDGLILLWTHTFVEGFVSHKQEILIKTLMIISGVGRIACIYVCLGIFSIPISLAFWPYILGAFPKPDLLKNSTLLSWLDKEGHKTKMGPIKTLPWDSYTDAGKKILSLSTWIRKLFEDAGGQR